MINFEFLTFNFEFLSLSPSPRADPEKLEYRETRDS